MHNGQCKDIKAWHWGQFLNCLSSLRPIKKAVVEAEEFYGTLQTASSAMILTVVLLKVVAVNPFYR